MKRSLAVELDLLVIGGPSIPLAAPNSSPIYSYANHLISVAATDAQGERREYDIKFVSCDFEIGSIDLILGFPWLNQVNPAIDFKTTS